MVYLFKTLCVIHKHFKNYHWQCKWSQMLVRFSLTFSKIRANLYFFLKFSENFRKFANFWFFKIFWEFGEISKMLCCHHLQCIWSQMFVLFALPFWVTFEKISVIDMYCKLHVYPGDPKFSLYLIQFLSFKLKFKKVCFFKMATIRSVFTRFLY